MSAAALALLIQLAPGALQFGGQIAGNIHQDVLGAQAVQIAYYQATAAYWNAHPSRSPQGRCCCRKASHGRR